MLYALKHPWWDYKYESQSFINFMNFIDDIHFEKIPVEILKCFIFFSKQLHQFLYAHEEK